MPNLKQLNNSLKDAELFVYLKLSTHVMVNMNEIMEVVTVSQWAKQDNENLKSMSTLEMQDQILDITHISLVGTSCTHLNTDNIDMRSSTDYQCMEEHLKQFGKHLRWLQNRIQEYNIQLIIELKMHMQ